MDDFRQKLVDKIEDYNTLKVEAEERRDFASMHINSEFINLLTNILSDYDNYVNDASS